MKVSAEIAREVLANRNSAGPHKAANRRILAEKTLTKDNGDLVEYRYHATKGWRAKHVLE